MKLLDYHRLRHSEERSWDRNGLRNQAGDQFIFVVESSLDDAARLCALYRAADEPQRVWLRSRVDRALARKLSGHAIRAAKRAAREHDASLSFDALTAFAIVDLAGGDIRDVLIGLSLICHCAALAGAAVPEQLRQGAAIAGPAMQTLFTEWADGYPDVPRIGVMGWRKIQTSEGIDFRQA